MTQWVRWISPNREVSSMWHAAPEGKPTFCGHELNYQDLFYEAATPHDDYAVCLLCLRAFEKAERKREKKQRRENGTSN